MAKASTTGPEDYLNGHRVTTEPAKISSWVSSPLWKTEAPDEVPEKLRHLVPEGYKPITLPFQQYLDARQKLGEEARLIEILGIAFYDSWYATPEGTVLSRTPHTLGENILYVIGLHETEDSAPEEFARRYGFSRD